MCVSSKHEWITIRWNKMFTFTQNSYSATYIMTTTLQNSLLYAKKRAADCVKNKLTLSFQKKINKIQLAKEK